MFSIQALQKIQDNYSDALGIPICIINLQGNKIIWTHNENKIWLALSNIPEAQKAARISLNLAIEKCQRTGQIVIFERRPSCHSFMAPIYAAGQIIGYFLGGMVRYGNPDINIAEKEASILQMEIDEYLDAYLKLPFFTENRLIASANLIKVVGSTIYHLENQGSNIRTKQQEVIEKNSFLSKNLEKTTNHLAFSENRYKQLFDTMIDGIFISDMVDGTILDVNKAGTQILGYNHPKDLIGSAIKSFYQDDQERYNFTRIIASKGKVQNWIAKVKNAKGEDVILETDASIMTDYKTGHTLIQGIFRDLSNRKHRNI